MYFVDQVKRPERISIISRSQQGFNEGPWLVLDLMGFALVSLESVIMFFVDLNTKIMFDMWGIFDPPKA